MASTTSSKQDQKHTAESFGHEAKEKAGQFASDAKDKAGQFAQDAKDKAGSFVQDAKEKAGNVMDKAKEVAGNVADKASSMAQGARKTAENLGDRAEGAMHTAGSGLKSGGEFIRENAPQGGMLGNAASYAADTLDSTGRYLEQHGLGELGGDVTNMIRRNPIPALLCAAALGFLLARASRS